MATQWFFFSFLFFPYVMAPNKKFLIPPPEWMAPTHQHGPWREGPIMWGWVTPILWWRNWKAASHGKSKILKVQKARGGVKDLYGVTNKYEPYF